MMRKTITRTLATTTIKAVALTVVDGAPVVETLDPVAVVGKPTEAEAIKAVKDVHGTDRAVSILAMDTDSAVYEISVADFLAHAKKVEHKVDEEPEQE